MLLFPIWFLFDIIVAHNSKESANSTTNNDTEQEDNKSLPWNDFSYITLILIVICIVLSLSSVLMVLYCTLRGDASVQARRSMVRGLPVNSAEISPVEEQKGIPMDEVSELDMVSERDIETEDAIRSNENKARKSVTFGLDEAEKRMPSTSTQPVLSSDGDGI